MSKINRMLTTNSRGDLEYKYDFDEEFSKDNLKNRVKLIKALLPLSLHDLILLSDIGHCLKRCRLRSWIYPRGKIVDRFEFDLQLLLHNRNDDFYLHANSQKSNSIRFLLPNMKI